MPFGVIGFELPALGGTDQQPGGWLAGQVWQLQTIGLHAPRAKTEAEDQQRFSCVQKFCIVLVMRFLTDRAARL